MGDSEIKRVPAEFQDEGVESIKASPWSSSRIENYQSIKPSHFTPSPDKET